MLLLQQRSQRVLTADADAATPIARTPNLSNGTTLFSTGPAGRDVTVHSARTHVSAGWCDAAPHTHAMQFVRRLVLDSVEIGSGQRLGLTHHVRSYIPNDVVTEANAGESRKAAWTENRNDAACLACTRSVGRRMRFRACLTSGLPAYLA